MAANAPQARLDGITSHSFGIKHSPYIGHLKGNVY